MKKFILRPQLPQRPPKRKWQEVALSDLTGTGGMQAIMLRPCNLHKDDPLAQTLHLEAYAPSACLHWQASDPQQGHLRQVLTLLLGHQD